MDVRLEATSLKTFASAIQCLSRIGKDLLIEADQEQLVLRVLNDSRSCFAAFYLFPEDFFEEFVCGREDGSAFTCRLMLKAVLGVLKSIRHVSSLHIYLDEGQPAAEDDDEHQRAAIEPHLVFDLQSASGIEKRHLFHIQDWEVIQAVFNPDGASTLTNPASQLTQLLGHIHGSHEVAFYADDGLVLVRTARLDDPLGAGATDGTPGAAALSTEMTMSSGDFEEYDLAGEEEKVGLVFNVREVKSFLSFCESLGGPNTVSIKFHDGGRPILFTAEGRALRVDLVLSTSKPSDGDVQLTQSKRERTMSRRGASTAASQQHQPQEEEEAPPPPSSPQGQEDHYQQDREEEAGAQ